MLRQFFCNLGAHKSCCRRKLIFINLIKFSAIEFILWNKFVITKKQYRWPKKLVKLIDRRKCFKSVAFMIAFMIEVFKPFLSFEFTSESIWNIISLMGTRLIKNNM